MSDNFIDRPEGILWFESAAVRDHFKPAGLTEIRDLCAGSSSLRRTLSEFGTRLIVLYWVQQGEGGLESHLRREKGSSPSSLCDKV